MDGVLLRTLAQSLPVAAPVGCFPGMRMAMASAAVGGMRRHTPAACAMAIDYLFPGSHVGLSVSVPVFLYIAVSRSVLYLFAAVCRLFRLAVAQTCLFGLRVRPLWPTYGGQGPVSALRGGEYLELSRICFCL